MSIEPVPEPDLGHELMRFGRMTHVMKAELAALVPRGLDPAAGQLLHGLVRSGACRQADLADRSFLDPSTVSRRISQLVALKLVERRADPGDGRAMLLEPTEAGLALVERLRAHREDVVRQVLADWPAADVAHLGHLLARLNDGLEAARAPQSSGVHTRTVHLTHQE